MRTDEMIQQVRDQMLEFDVDPVTDRAILSRLNFAYQYAFNHLVKSNDSLYAKWHYMLISPGLSYYTIPKHLWGKRVETLEAPTPPQTGYEPYNYVEVMRRDPQSIARYDSPRARTLMPMAWTQVRNKILIVPPPLVQTKIRILVTERPPTLGLVEGIVTSYLGDKLILDRDTTELTSGLSKQNFNFLSICDYMTGEVKAVYPYSAVGAYDPAVGTEVTLATNTGLTSYYGKTLAQCYSYAVSKVDYDVATKILTITTTDTITGISAGQIVEASMDVEEGEKYNIVDTLVDDTDFYDRPEYEVPATTLTRKATVLTVGTNTITWYDPSFVPTFINRYPNPPGATFTISVSGAAGTTYEGSAAVEVTLATAHGLTLGNVAKVTFVSSYANLTGTLKCIPTTTTKLIVLIASLGAGSLGVATATLYQYSAAYVGTGLPAITNIDSTRATKLQLRISADSPYAYTQRVAQTNNDPDAYDHDNDIQIGDVVVYGYNTGIPIIPEPYHQVLVEWCAIVAKSGFNESDAEVTAILKEMMTDLKGDTAGRKLGTTISRDFGIRSTYLLQSRRMGRR